MLQHIVRPICAFDLALHHMAKAALASSIASVAANNILIVSSFGSGNAA